MEKNLTATFATYQAEENVMLERHWVERLAMDRRRAAWLLDAVEQGYKPGQIAKMVTAAIGEPCTPQRIAARIREARAMR